MASAEMWWAGDSVSRPAGITTTFTFFGLRVSGRQDGPGVGPLAVTLGEFTTALVLSRRFFLNTGRMPPSDPQFGDRYVSAPIVNFTGDLFCTAGGCTWFGDCSEVECNLRVRQVLAPGGTPTQISFREINLVTISGSGTANPVMPPRVGFNPIFFTLDRTMDLIIDLQIAIMMRLKGVSSLAYSRFPESQPFNIAAPQWSIVSSP
jgi:hypothetical protein